MEATDEIWCCSLTWYLGCEPLQDVSAHLGLETAISIAETFKTFLSNLAIDNHATIELRYGEITSALNQEFVDS